MSEQLTIDDVVEALKVEYPYLERDVEMIEIGDKLRREMIANLSGGKGVDIESDVKIQDAKDLNEKLELYENALKLTGIMKTVVEKIIPIEDHEQFTEAGAGVRKFRQRQGTEKQDIPKNSE